MNSDTENKQNHVTVSITTKDQKTRKILCPKGQRLFFALQDKGINLSHGCLAGSCGTCLIKVKSKKFQCVEIPPVEYDTLCAVLPKMEEGSSVDFRLSCRYVLNEDIEIIEL